MRPLLAVMMSLMLLCSIAGCSLNEQFVASVDESWQVIGPRYVAYVEADPALDAESKMTRIRSAVLLTEVIAEAKK